MITAIAPVFALLLSVALLLTGNGLQGTLLPIRGNLEQFSATELGLLGTFYFVGFGAGCYFGGRLVRRAGHIRTFAAMASIASTMALLHIIWITPLSWWLARSATGFCFAVLYVVIESWLNERATNETRGLVLAIYNMVNLTVITIGQMMLTLYDPASYPLFILSSALVSMAVVPVCMTASAAPAPVEAVRLRLGRLYRTSPLGCMGALAVGTANGSFWTLAPVFAQDIGLNVAGVAVFMSTAVLAGAAGQWPLGRLSDKRDRRQVILLACILSCAAGVAMVLLMDQGTIVLLGPAIGYGMFAFPLYALSVAHTNDYVAPEDFVEASSGILMLYAIGAAIGPMPASLAMEHLGPAGLFAFTAVVHAATAVFAIVRMRARPAIPQEEKEAFVSVPRTSPTLYAMDPRSHPEDAEEAAPDAEAGEEKHKEEVA